MIKAEDTFLVLVDVQGKLAASMHEKEALFSQLRVLVQAMKALNIPIVWVEHVPEKMGPTVPEVAGLLAGETPVAKSSFSCWGEPAFQERIKALKRKTALIAGIEAHVCVYQTAAELVEAGYAVQVVADAISSRTKANRKIGLARAAALGAGATSVETIVFELLRTAKHPAFKAVLSIVK